MRVEGTTPHYVVATEALWLGRWSDVHRGIQNCWCWESEYWWILIGRGRNCEAMFVLVLGFMLILHHLHPLSLLPGSVPSHARHSRAGLDWCCCGFSFRRAPHRGLGPGLDKKGHIIFCYIALGALHALASKQFVQPPWTLFAQSVREERNLLSAFRFSSFHMCFIPFSLHNT